MSRAVHVDGKEFPYRTSGSWTHILLQDGSVHTVSYPELTGETWNVLERGHWKGHHRDMVLPWRVKDYLERRLRHDGTISVPKEGLGLWEINTRGPKTPHRRPSQPRLNASSRMRR